MAFLGALLLLSATCGGHRGAATPSLKDAAGGAVAGGAALPGERELTGEERMIMQMPYEQRLQYLRQRYRELVKQYHGIDIGEGEAVKTASLEDPYHKVCKKASDAIPKELFNLVQTAEDPKPKWEWTLTFLERLSGDYNFDHVVDISDVTQIAIHYGAKEGDEDWMEAPYHIDRNSNGDGVINIADVTPLAISFGKQLAGYNAYWRDSTGGEWRLIARRELSGS